MNFLAGSEKRFFEFMGNLDEKDKIAVISHDDGDGLGSAVIASKVIGKIDLVYFYGYMPGTFFPMLNEIKKKKINKVFLLDLNLPEEETLEIAKTAEVIVIDHHPFTKDLNSERIAFLNAECGAACYVCYYLFSKLQKVPEWAAEIGTLSDTSPWKYDESNLEEFYTDFGFKKIENLWKDTLYLSFALIYLNGKTRKIYDLMMKAEDFSELGIEKYSDKVEKEIEKQIKNYGKKKEENDGLIFYYFEPKFDVKTFIINKISTENYDTLLVFVQKLKGEDSAGISFRSQSGRVNCPELLKKAIVGIPNSNAGGHLRAAGGRVPVAYLGKFKENLLREYVKMAGGKV